MSIGGERWYSANRRSGWDGGGGRGRQGRQTIGSRIAEEGRTPKIWVTN